MVPELTTPFFIYQDQIDHKTMESIGIFPTKEGVFDDTEMWIMHLIAGNIIKSVKIGDGYRPGVYLTRTGYHTAFLGPRFFINYMDGPSIHDVLVNWLEGSGVMSVVDETPWEDTAWDSAVQLWNKFDSPQPTPEPTPEPVPETGSEPKPKNPCACQ